MVRSLKNPEGKFDYKIKKFDAIKLGRVRFRVKDFRCEQMKRGLGQLQIPTRIPEKNVVALFSGIVVNSGIVVEAGRLHTSKIKRRIYHRNERFVSKPSFR